MDTTKQFNQEFDRIFYLITTTCDYRFGRLYNAPDYKFIVSIESFCDLNFYKKIEVLHKIFTAKDEKGEWILQQADLPNPKYIKHNDKYNTNADEMFLVDTFIPKTLRDLFLLNCIPSNDPEQDKTKIENLKLIKW